MTNPQFVTLYQQLAKRVKDRTAVWAGSTVRDRFILKMDAGTLIFDRYVAEDGSRPWFSIGIGKSDTETLDEYAVLPDNDWYPEIDELFDTIQRQVNGSEEMYLKMMAELQDTGIVGNSTKIADETYDPFPDS